MKDRGSRIAITSPTLHAHAWTPVWRGIAGLLVLLSRASLPGLALAIVGLQDEMPTLPVLLQAVAALSILPAIAAALIARAHAVTLRADGDLVHVESRSSRMTITSAEMDTVRSWRVPLPEPGASVAYGSASSPARIALGVRDPAALAALFARAGSAPASDAALGAAARWAHARAARVGGLAGSPVVKFGLFALAPTAVLFNAHQHIAYGGPLGQYHLEGLGPYLRTFAEYWTTVALYLVLYASVWRALAEIVCFAAASVAPPRAAAVRRTAERVCLGLFYAGVPALVALRFLA